MAGLRALTHGYAIIYNRGLRMSVYAGMRAGLEESAGIPAGR